MTAEDRSSLKKQYTFKNYEMAQFWCQEVAQESHKIDHHPEWRLINNGCTIDVKLTSHFADNTVTRLDFELAEAMNTAEVVANNKFVMHPWFTNAEWTTIKIFCAFSAVGIFWWRYFTTPAVELTANPSWIDPRERNPVLVETRMAFTQSRAGEVADRNMEKAGFYHATKSVML